MNTTALDHLAIEHVVLFLIEHPSLAQRKAENNWWTGVHGWRVTQQSEAATTCVAKEPNNVWQRIVRSVPREGQPLWSIRCHLWNASISVCPLRESLIDLPSWPDERFVPSNFLSERRMQEFSRTGRKTLFSSTPPANVLDPPRLVLSLLLFTPNDRSGSLSACCAACNSYRACQAFSFDEGNGICYMKNCDTAKAPGPSTALKRVTSGIRSSQVAE